MGEDFHELPMAELYRGVEIYGLQSAERIAEAKRQIDLVIRTSGPRKLCEFACDPLHAPEARSLAKKKALASLERRQRATFDAARLSACTVGIERRETCLGRLMGGRDAGWPSHGWPAAWRRPARFE